VTYYLVMSTRLTVSKNLEQDPRKRSRKEGRSQRLLWLGSLGRMIG
jgi:hypothetical protein